MTLNCMDNFFKYGVEKGFCAGRVALVAGRKSYNQNCPIARGLDILGERWTLLILRELLGGPRRYSDVRAELLGIATNLLAERLKDLQDNGLVDRAELPPPVARTVYALSDAGWQRVRGWQRTESAEAPMYLVALSRPSQGRSVTVTNPRVAA